MKNIKFIFIFLISFVFLLGMPEIISKVRQEAAPTVATAQVIRRTTAPIAPLPAPLTMSPALRKHYAQLRSEIYDKYMVNRPSGNVRFYVAATLHDLSQMKWSQCDNYEKATGQDCNSAITANLIVLVRQITAGTGELEAIRRIYNYVSHDIKYKEEPGDIQYFPYETLVLGAGDCEGQAMLLATLLRIAGFETAFLSINDPKENFYHVFCIVRIHPQWTPIKEWKFDRYANYGHCWKILDPAFNKDFDSLPAWFNKYREARLSYIPAQYAEVITINTKEYRRLSTKAEYGSGGPTPVIDFSE